MSIQVFLRCVPALVFAGALVWGDEPTFKSDVALTRVDAQVVDRDGRAITGLQQNDFILKVNGKPVPIRNFASEDMPIDILLLLDVSGSMEPHVERIASAARQALRVLAPQDRVAIMVFDTSTRVRLPFSSNHDDVAEELDHLIRSEGFNGGTRITSAMISAANYVARQARPEARRAIVILTDDETQDSEDEPRVEHALARANAVLSFLQAPYEPPTAHGGMGRRRGGWGGGGGGWPGGGGIGFPGGGGGIGFPGGGRRGGYGGVDPSHTAGTETIAQDSGGDTFPVTQASALEDTLARLRQRYALHYYIPEGLTATDQQNVRVELSEQARIRYTDADIHYRRVFISGANGEHAGPPEVTHSSAPASSGDSSADSTSADTSASSSGSHKHTAVNEDSGPRINTVSSDSSGNTATQPAPSSAPASAPPTQSQPAQQPAPPPANKGGWPKAN